MPTDHIDNFRLNEKKGLFIEQLENGYEQEGTYTDLTLQNSHTYLLAFKIDQLKNNDNFIEIKIISNGENILKEAVKDRGKYYYKFNTTQISNPVRLSFTSYNKNHIAFVLNRVDLIDITDADQTFNLANSQNTPIFVPSVLTFNDYYPFGMLMNGRYGGDTQGYKYGYQGQEMDNEIKGVGNSINYKYRMHDPRLGRFFAIDPLFRKYPWNSSYAFSENRVIAHVELEGLESMWFGYDGLDTQQINEINQTVSKKSGETILDILEFTDVEDITILVTWLTTDKSVGVKEEEATSVDKGFATAGIFLPFVSGSAVREFFKEIGEGGEWVFKQLLKNEGDTKIFRNVGKLLTLGEKRENLVADMVNGIVAKGENGKDLVVRSRDKTLGATVDVISENGDLISVGGKAKMKNLASFNSTLATLKKIAAENGVKAKAYLADNSPKELIEREQKTLGDENVVIFKDPTD